VSKTNFEVITESPEKLAKAISQIVDCEYCPASGECAKWISYETCAMLLTDWLKAEYAENSANKVCQNISSIFSKPAESEIT